MGAGLSFLTSSTTTIGSPWRYSGLSVVTAMCTCATAGVVSKRKPTALGADLMRLLSRRGLRTLGDSMFAHFDAPALGRLGSEKSPTVYPGLKVARSALHATDGCAVR